MYIFFLVSNNIFEVFTMNLNQGNLFWNENIDIIKKYPYISKDRLCDVLVIGGGIGGALTAYMQAKQGVNVIVVDKNIFGYGATLATDGTIIRRMDITDNKCIKGLEQKTIDKCNELCSEGVDEIIKIINEISNDAECKKYIDKLEFKQLDLMCYSEKIMSKIPMYKLFEKFGKQNKNIEYLEQDPLINLRTGMIIPSGGAILNPYVLTQLIFLYLSKMDNVEIYENTCIEKIHPIDDKVECITSNRFKIHSKCVILTTGTHSLKYIENADVTLNKVFTIVTDRIENLETLDTNIVAKDITNSNSIVTFTNDKRIVFSGELCKESEKELTKKYLKNFADGRYKKLYLELNKLINLPVAPKISNCFYGMYIETKDMLPIIDELYTLPNVYCNLGVGRNGIVYSMIGANMLKNISKKYHVKDMYLFRENR